MSVLFTITLIFLFFFFLMIRRPPRSTLFPTRRSSDLFALRCGAEKREIRLFSKTLHDELQDGRVIEDLFAQDRKSTRLNSSHMSISYAVFCLKKKKYKKTSHPKNKHLYIL